MAIKGLKFTPYTLPMGAYCMVGDKTYLLPVGIYKWDPYYIGGCI